MNIVDVPKEFQPLPYAIRYPMHHTGPHLEDYAYDFFRQVNKLKKIFRITDIIDRWYLPIFWDSYYISHGFGESVDKLKEYIASLSTDRKYFTIVQYSAPVIEVPDCLVFSSGGIGDVPLPLLTSPHPTNGDEKIYKASFMGKVHLHQCRLEMLEFFNSLPLVESANYFISDSMGTEAFRQVMNESVFALCPRGSGKTSFRLYEAMQMGCIPIYIFNEEGPWLPYQDKISWPEFCLLIEDNNIESIPAIIDNIGRLKRISMIAKARSLWAEYFTLDGVCKQIVRMLEEEE